MNQNEEDENEKLDDVLKKHYFSFDTNMGELDKIVDYILDKTLFDSSKIYDVVANYDAKVFDTFIIFGTNAYGETVFKNKHFVVDKLKTEYLNHIRTHAVHTLKQPAYYLGLFEILN